MALTLLLLLCALKDFIALLEQNFRTNIHALQALIILPKEREH